VQYENTWETYEKVLQSSEELLLEFYEKNPIIKNDGGLEKISFVQYSILFSFGITCLLREV
jgi:hypothetical protein